MRDFEELRAFSDLIKKRNQLDKLLAVDTGRPAHNQHLAESIAAWILGITLEEAANNQGSDGHFSEEPLTTRSVNIKYSALHTGTLDLPQDAHLNRETLPDYYLAVRGPKAGAASSKGAHHPFVIQSAFLFETNELLEALCARGVKIGAPTSVYGALWQRAEIYPVARSPIWILPEAYKSGFDLFNE